MTAPAPRIKTPIWLGALLAVLLVGAGIHSAVPLWNGDYFWHVSSGHLYLDTGSLPDQDPLTYTAGDSQWVHHEWLAQLILATVEDRVGLGGSRLFRAGLVMVGLALVWVGARHVGVAVFAVVLAAWLGLAPNTGLRPHLVAWPVLAAVLVALVPYLLGPRRIRRRPGAAVPWIAFTVAVVLWVNLHSSALVVPLLAGATAAGALVDRLTGRLRDDRALWTSGAAAALGGVACVLQPSGFGLFSYALETPDVNVRSQEWAPLFTPSTFEDAPILVVAWVLLALGTAAAGIAERRRPGGVGPGFPSFWTALLCLVLAFEHRRMTIFLMLPMLYLAQAAAPLLVQRLRRESNRVRPGLWRTARGLAIAAARGITTADRAMRAGAERWLHDGNRNNTTLLGATVGFVGCGGIAQSLLRMLEPFGVRALGYDPPLGDARVRAAGFAPRALD
ncbi:MAG: NAD(P)-dependent oxidoreductase, partial [Acidobacteriota bacterium]